MSKNVNNDVSKDSPILRQYCELIREYRNTLLLLPEALKYRATDGVQRVNYLCFVTEVSKSTLPSFL